MPCWEEGRVLGTTLLALGRVMPKARNLARGHGQPQQVGDALSQTGGCPEILTPACGCGSCGAWAS